MIPQYVAVSLYMAQPLSMLLDQQILIRYKSIAHLHDQVLSLMDLAGLSLNQHSQLGHQTPSYLGCKSPFLLESLSHQDKSCHYLQRQALHQCRTFYHQFHCRRGHNHSHQYMYAIHMQGYHQSFHSHCDHTD